MEDILYPHTYSSVLMSMCLGLYVCMSACVYMHVYLGTTIWEDYLAESETLSYMHVLCVYVYVCICVCARSCMWIVLQLT